MSDFRKPFINAPTPEGQLRQVKDFLYQLTDSLNFAVKRTEKEISEIRRVTIGDTEDASGKGDIGDSVNNTSGEKSENEKTLDTFLKLKTLIIKSADIVDSYYDVIEKRLTGKYTAISDLGTYKDTVNLLVTQTADNKTEFRNSIQEIYNKTGDLSEIRKDGFYLRTGWLDTVEGGNKLGGIELGQTSEDGKTTTSSFARFTSKELTFYDGNGTEDKNKLAWISNAEMNIRKAKIEISLEVGGYIEETNLGLAFRWVGEN